MPLQTVICPECAHALTVDVPLGNRATLTHREGTDLLKIVPRIQPLFASLQPPKPGNPFDTGDRGGVAKSISSTTL